MKNLLPNQIADTTVATTISEQANRLDMAGPIFKPHMLPIVILLIFIVASFIVPYSIVFQCLLELMTLG